MKQIASGLLEHRSSKNEPRTRTRTRAKIRGCVSHASLVPTNRPAIACRYAESRCGR